MASFTQTMGSGYAGFLEAMTRQYADFKGRTRRRDFWMFYLYYMLAFLPIAIILGITGTLMGWSEQAQLRVLDLIFLLTVIPTFAIGVRRLHDLGYSGWWGLPGVIATPFVLWWPPLEMVGMLVSVIYLLWFLLPGQPRANKWGPDPKAVDVVTPHVDPRT